LTKYILAKRKEILKKIIKFNRNHKYDEDYLKSPLSYPCTWYNNLGYEFIKTFYKKNIYNFIFQFIKEILIISNLHNYKALSKKINNKKKYNNLRIFLL